MMSLFGRHQRLSRSPLKRKPRCRTHEAIHMIAGTAGGYMKPRPLHGILDQANAEVGLCPGRLHTAGSGSAAQCAMASATGYGGQLLLLRGFHSIASAGVEISFNANLVLVRSVVAGASCDRVVRARTNIGVRAGVGRIRSGGLAHTSEFYFIDILSRARLGRQDVVLVLGIVVLRICFCCCVGTA